MKRTDRMLGILLRLRGERVVPETELASYFEVSVRTIYRDVDALSELGVPIYVERGRTGGFKLLKGYFLPALALTREEAISLAHGVTMLRSLRTRPHASALDAAERKLLAAMPAHLYASSRRRRSLSALSHHRTMQLRRKTPRPRRTRRSASSANIRRSIHFSRASSTVQRSGCAIGHPIARPPARS